MELAVVLLGLSIFTLPGIVFGYLMGWQGCFVAYRKQLKAYRELQTRQEELDTAKGELEKITFALFTVTNVLGSSQRFGVPRS